MPRISVGIRVRPIEKGGQTVLEYGNGNAATLCCNVSGAKHEFSFDKLYDEVNGTQEAIFESCTAPMIDEAIDGFNGCVFAYGQTGAGKTHTMSGPPEGSYTDRGLCARVVSYLFQKGTSLSRTVDITLRLSVLEVYNELVTDLLMEPPEVKRSMTPVLLPKLSVVDAIGGVQVPGLLKLPILCDEDAFSLLVDAQVNRSVGEHQLNRNSTRSHVITTFYITRTRHKSGGEQAGKGSGETEEDLLQSKFHIVDLAGSERASKTGSTGSTQKEAKYINKSLSYLEQVVIALTQVKRDHIPYRQSKLTHLLKDSLGGNCNTFMIACVWPRHDHSWETLSTLRFASRMKSIEMHPVRNSLISKAGGDTNSVSNANLVQQVEMLKKELAMRDSIVRGRNLTPAEIWLPELSRAQKLKTYKQCLQLLKSDDVGTTADSSASGSDAHLRNDDNLSLSKRAIDTIEVKSLSHVYLMLGTLKTTLREHCGQDSVEVAAALKKTLLSHNTAYTDKIEDFFRECFAAPSQEEADVETPITLSSGSGSPGKASGKGKHEEEAMSSPSSVNRSPSNDPTPDKGREGGMMVEDGGRIEAEGSERSREEVNRTFDDFVSGEGAALNDAFEGTKEALRVNKARQKEIIGLLNSQKRIIDDIQSKVDNSGTEPSEDDIYMGNGDADDLASGEKPSGGSKDDLGFPSSVSKSARIKLEAEIHAAKKRYRSAHKELQLCKEQIQETQSLKKRAMATLLSAYNDYQKSSGT